MWDQLLSLMDLVWELALMADSYFFRDQISSQYLFSICNLLLYCYILFLSVYSLFLIQLFSFSSLLFTRSFSSSFFYIYILYLSYSLYRDLYFYRVYLVSACCAYIIVWYFCPLVFRYVISSVLFLFQQALSKDWKCQICNMQFYWAIYISLTFYCNYYMRFFFMLSFFTSLVFYSLASLYDYWSNLFTSSLFLISVCNFLADTDFLTEVFFTLDVLCCCLLIECRQFYCLFLAPQQFYFKQSCFWLEVRFFIGYFQRMQE